jgi:carbamoyl-phosphate synthase small subunit
MSSIKYIEGTLYLEDGTKFTGKLFGKMKNISGEIVFNTSMVGYPEALTDPSYKNQILVLTYPSIGNYGVPPSVIEDNMLKYFESNKIQISGLIVSDYCDKQCHWNSEKTLSKWMEENNIPGLYNIDTRQLTKIIRNKGTMNAIINFNTDNTNNTINTINTNNTINTINTINTNTINTNTINTNTINTNTINTNTINTNTINTNNLNLVKEVSNPLIREYNISGKYKIIVLDCGIKNNIIRMLLKFKDIYLKIVPYNYEINEDYDGLFISNGPGDPKDCIETINIIKNELKKNNPIFGICLGNQLLGLAGGCNTIKLKYGNRSVNQPVIDLMNRKCYISSQNHGYAIDMETLPQEWKPYYINANDFSNEGIIHETKPFFGVQFHPEACAGPTDTDYLFEHFIKKVKGEPISYINKNFNYYYQIKQNNISKVLILGSGGLSIGQAGEFDYSGSQAIKALKEENIETILINPNIATVQTSKNMADKIYYLAVNKENVMKIIENDKLRRTNCIKLCSRII